MVDFNNQANVGKAVVEQIRGKEIADVNKVTLGSLYKSVYKDTGLLRKIKYYGLLASLTFGQPLGKVSANAYTAYAKIKTEVDGIIKDAEAAYSATATGDDPGNPASYIDYDSKMAQIKRRAMNYVQDAEDDLWEALPDLSMIIDYFHKSNMVPGPGNEF